MLQFVWLSSFLFTAQAEPPSMAEILRTLPPLGYSIPYVYQVSRDEIEVVQEKLVDRVDSLRFFPLLGWAQLHHCHWKCTVYFVEKTELNYPFHFQMTKNRVEVVYIDRNQLEFCGQNQQAEQPAQQCKKCEQQPVEKGLVSGCICGAGLGTAVGLATRNPAAVAAVRRETLTNQMSTADIIQMTQGGIDDDNIIQQMNSTNSVFHLTTADVASLQTYGVSSRVITHMQTRRPRTIVGQTTGTTINNGMREPVTGPARQTETQR